MSWPAVLAGAASALLVALPVLAYRLGFRAGLRWRDDCEAHPVQQWAETWSGLDMQAIEDEINRAEWRRAMGADDGG
jgi:hypothetical protein